MKRGTGGASPRVLSALVVSGGGFSGLTVIKALREVDGVRVVLADCFPENVGRYFADAFHAVPEIARKEAFLAALLQVCEEEEIRLVVPATPYELLSLAGERAAFESRGALLAVSDPDLLDLVGDKARLYAFLRAEEIPVLPLVDPLAPDAPFPLLAKPVSGWGGQGRLVLRSPGEAAAWWTPGAATSHVVQPFLEGCDELSVDFDLDFRGALSEVGVRRRVRTSGGFAVISDSAADAEVEAHARRFASLALSRGGRGPFNLQFLRRGREVYLNDVNPRLGVSSIHWSGAGWSPLGHLCASLSRKSRTAPARPRRPVRMVRHLEELWVEVPGQEGPRGVRGFVFDLDDTLLSTKKWTLGKLEAVHKAHRADLPERGPFLREAMRLLEEGARSDLFDALAGRFGFPGALKTRLIEAYRSAVPSVNPLFPDVVTTLDGLSRRGLRLGLLTDNPPASQAQKIQACGLDAFFHGVVFAREEGGEKPHPDGFRAVAERLGLPTGELAMVGDNPHRDVQGALEAGYARAYALTRPGGLLSFDLEVFEKLSPWGRRFRTLSTLRELLRA